MQAEEDLHIIADRLSPSNLSGEGWTATYNNDNRPYFILDFGTTFSGPAVVVAMTSVGDSRIPNVQEYMDGGSVDPNRYYVYDYNDSDPNSSSGGTFQFMAVGPRATAP